MKEKEEWIIEIEVLSKTFGPIFALRELSLRLKKGKFLTIFGPNGAGKTTLIKVLSTLSKPSSGWVKIAGYELKEEGEEARRRIGVISHHPFLYEGLTAKENLEFYGKMYGLKNLREKIREVIKEVGLELRRDYPVRTFSRGMQQRLSIGRAIMHDPEILLLDEPHTGLDQEASEILKNILARFQKEEKTIVMTTHDLSSGLRLAKEVAILKGGTLVYREEIRNIDLENFPEIYFNYTGKVKEADDS